MLNLALQYVLFEGFFIGGFLVVKKIAPYSRYEIPNDVAGAIYAVIGVIYAVLLAFVVVTVWDQYSDAERNINTESCNVVDIYRDANAFPDSIKKEIQGEAGNYINNMITYEWKAMYTIKISEEASQSYLTLFKLLQNYTPVSTYENIWYTETIKKLNQLADARRLRINSIYYNIPFFLWMVLLLGALLAIGFSYLFDAKNRVAHLIMVFCLSSTIVLVLILIEVMEHPFSKLIHVTPEAFIRALEQLK